MDRLREQLRIKLRRRGFSQHEIAMELREYDHQKREFSNRAGAGTFHA